MAKRTGEKRLGASGRNLRLQLKKCCDMSASFMLLSPPPHITPQMFVRGSRGAVRCRSSGSRNICKAAGKRVASCSGLFHERGVTLSL
jgi:hypothetical protein